MSKYYMIIDCHAHIGEANNRMWTADDLLASMREAGIDYSLVISDRTSRDISTIEHILEETKKHSQIKAIGDVEFTTLNYKQIDTLIKLLEKDKIVGLKFYLGYEEYYPNNPKLFPLYEYCQDNNKPVVYHTGALEAGSRGLLKYSNPITVDEVANLFPDLKIVMAHMGYPFVIECAAVMAKNENVYADVSAFFTEYDPIDPEEIEIFISRLKDVWLVLGSYEKFLFGSDWPLYSQKEYVEATKKLPLSKKEKELVFWKNAAKIFNLKV